MEDHGQISESSALSQVSQVNDQNKYVILLGSVFAHVGSELSPLRVRYILQKMRILKALTASMRSSDLNQNMRK